MIDDLMSKTPYAVVSLIQYCIENSELSDYLEQLYRNLNKEVTSTFDNQKKKVICDPSVQRHIKNLIIFEVNLKKKNPDFELHFTPKIAEILKKDLNKHLTERSSFIIATI